MSERAPHPTGPDTGAAATVLRLLLWLFVVLAGFTVVLVLPSILVLTATGESRPGIWPVYLWLLMVFLACLYAVVSGLQAMAHPHVRRVALFAGLALIAFLSCPLFWLPEA